MFKDANTSEIIYLVFLSLWILFIEIRLSLLARIIRQMNAIDYDALINMFKRD